MGLYNFTLAVLYGISFNSVPIAMDANECLLFEQHFDFSVPDAFLTEFVERPVKFDGIVHLELILNRQHDDKYIDCMMSSNVGMWGGSVCQHLLGGYTPKPRYNIIRAKLCKEGVSPSNGRKPINDI